MSRKTTIRFLALVLCICMVLSMSPVTPLHATAATESHPGSFTVTVKDQASAPVQGAEVLLSSQENTKPQEEPESPVPEAPQEPAWELSLTAETDAEGVAAFDAAEIRKAMEAAKLEKATVYATVRMEGYEEITSSMELTLNAKDPEAKPDQKPVETLAQNLDVQLKKAEPQKPQKQQATLTVNVLNAKGEPVADARAHVLVNSIEYKAPVTLEKGVKTPVSITPAEGCYIKELKLDGRKVELSENGSYEGEIALEKDTVIDATVVRQYTVTVADTVNGQILLNGKAVSTLKADENTKVTVKVQPTATETEKYHIKTVSIGGQAQEITDPAGYQTKLTVTGDVQISASFVRVYTVTVHANGNGEVVTDPSADKGGRVTVETGSAVRVTATPKKDFRVSQVLINGEKQTISDENGASYTKELTADQDYEIEVTFAEDRFFDVTVKKAENGSVTVDPSRVPYGGTSTVTIIPADGYNLKSVKVNGTEQRENLVSTETGFTLKLSNITEKQVIQAAFEVIPTIQDNVLDYFNDEDAVRVSGLTYIYDKDTKVTFRSLDADGIRLLSKATNSWQDNRNVIAGGIFAKSFSLDSGHYKNDVCRIKQVQLYYDWGWHGFDSVQEDTPLRIVIDRKAPELTITGPADRTVFGQNFDIVINAKDPTDDYSGITATEYFITAKDDRAADQYNTVLAEQKLTAVSEAGQQGQNQEIKFTVDVAKYTNDISVWVKTSDAAGNVTYSKQDFAINTKAPELRSVTIDQQRNTEAVSNFYKERTATVVIADRADSFDEAAATKAIQITATDRDGHKLAVQSDIVWQHDGGTYTATVRFTADAHFTWSVGAYQNKAGIDLDTSKASIPAGSDLYDFYVDNQAPEGEVTVAGKTWKNHVDDLLNKLTFGFWKTGTVEVTASASDNFTVQKVLFYKHSGTDDLTAADLEKLYQADLAAKNPTAPTDPSAPQTPAAEPNFVEKLDPISGDERFTVYARVTDNGGNVTYLSTDGVIVDNTKSGITIQILDQPNDNGIFTKNAGESGDEDQNIEVAVSVTEVPKEDPSKPYSGIKSIDYRIYEMDDDGSELESKDNLFTFDVQNPTYDQLVSSWNSKDHGKNILVDKEEFSKNEVYVEVTVTDNAGNVYTAKSNSMNINTDPVTAEIEMDGEEYFNDGERGYFNAAQRKATIVITDRNSSFNQDAATAGISVNAVDGAGQTVADSFRIDWAESGKNLHTATLTFLKNANYTWSMNYTNKADQKMTYDSKSQAPYAFTVDNVAPTGTITVNQTTWQKLVSTLTFGFYNEVTVSATGADDTSPVVLESYKSASDLALTEAELDKLYEKGEFSEFREFTSKADEQLTVYLRVRDLAGNYTYVSTDGVIVDNSASSIELIPEKANENGIYGLAYADGITVGVKVTDQTETEAYAGIKTVDYKVITDGDESKAIQSGNLFTFDVVNPTKDQLKRDFQGEIVVDPKLTNSCKTEVIVTVVDNANNTSTSRVALDVDVTAPTIDVTFDNNADNGGNTYFDAVRTATVVITERTHHFDPKAATAGIVITAVDAEGKPVEGAYTISDWATAEGATADAAAHTATIAFLADANYEWSVAYTDKADNAAAGVNTGASVAPFDFTVDTTAPEGTVTAVSEEGRKQDWNDLRHQDNLTFGFWSKTRIDMSAVYTDATSAPIADVSYYKASVAAGTKTVAALTEAQLDAIQEWKSFEKLTVGSDEQFVLYIRITDLAGNVRYISTNGLIVDHTIPFEEAIAPEITASAEATASGIYNSDVPVDIHVNDPVVGNTCSGLNRIWYEVKSLGKVTQSGELYHFENPDPKHEELLHSHDTGIIVDSELNNSNEIEIVIHALDNAANESEFVLPMKIDITAPTIDVRYDNNSADSGIYFKNDRTATVTVTERNFNADSVITAITNTDGVIPSISGFAKHEGAAGGNGDDTTWTATIHYAADGDYTFDINYTDMAANPCAGENFTAGTVAGNEFTVDKTVPVVHVSYSNNDVRNGNYYKDERTATIVINEHNLDPNGADSDRIVITTTASDDGSAIAAPRVSSWRTSGDRHTAVITYSADAHYTFDISVTDKAGNDAADYAMDDFFVDRTVPALEITGVADKSANSGDVIPVISYSDTNIDMSEVQITLTGANRKEVTPEGTYENVHNGQIFTFANFEQKQEIDDIYVLTATLTDKAGNTSTQSIHFSVNRFGSTYAMSESTEKLNGTYTQKPIDVVVTETNANQLSDIKVTLFKNNETIVLTEGKDYKMTVTGGAGQWFVYTYTVLDDNFTDDGVYRLTFHSKDEAGNIAENTLDTKDMEVGFGIDKTLPNIIVANLENGKTYALDHMTVQLSSDDNLLLSSVTVYLDDAETPYKTWSAEEVAKILASGGEFTFDISGDSKGAHIVRIVSVDAAGNTQTEEITGFYITTDLFVRYYNNKPLFYGSIFGTIAVAGLIVFLVVYKKKKNEENVEA